MVQKFGAQLDQRHRQFLDPWQNQHLFCICHSGVAIEYTYHKGRNRGHLCQFLLNPCIPILRIPYVHQNRAGHLCSLLRIAYYHRTSMSSHRNPNFFRRHHPKAFPNLDLCWYDLNLHLPSIRTIWVYTDVRLEQTQYPRGGIPTKPKRRPSLMLPILRFRSARCIALR